MGSWISLGGLKNDTTAPTTPVIAVAVISSTELDISLTTPSTDSGGLKQYVLERSPNGSTSWTTLATGASIFTYADTGLTASTTYYYRCTASDFAANSSVSATVNATTSSSGLVFSGLRSSIDMTIDDNTGGTDTIVWTSDGTGSFARITYVASGTIRLLWPYADRNQTGGYVKFESRFSASGKTAKHLKIFGQGYPTNYSNCTWPANAGAIPEIIYDDSASPTGGHDLLSETSFTGSLTGGGAYSRTPHPTINTTSSATNDTSWHTWEYWFKFNDDGINNGEFAAWKDSVLVFWISDVYNSGVGLSKRDYLTLGDFSAQSGWTLDFRNVDIGYSRPTGRGI
jgi:hypothetical protein